ncbi:phasin family protein [Hymenobacter coccineus]|uniref:Polyhydroxyalkanoate synthesis regulator phasin n=1 Tax=Hymenobacter coccineus TaxID=1908235 RepID=A0A1G1TJZ5_9BACT|nr:hypothetical protein [Hymenobacter coccineus]OGX91186.1 hypothetical protein BEN49_20700 [Hymenobacter coccineus]
MEDLFKKFINAGVGYLAQGLAQGNKKVQSTIETLVQESKLSEQEGKKIVDDLLKSGEAKRTELEQQFKGLAERMKDSVGLKGKAKAPAKKAPTKRAGAPKAASSVASKVAGATKKAADQVSDIAGTAQKSAAAKAGAAAKKAGAPKAAKPRAAPASPPLARLKRRRHGYNHCAMKCEDGVGCGACPRPPFAPTQRFRATTGGGKPRTLLRDSASQKIRLPVGKRIFWLGDP